MKKFVILLTISLLLINPQFLSNDLKGHTERVNSVDISPNGTIIISGGFDNNIKFWMINSDKELKNNITGHDDSIFTLKFSSNASMIVSGGWDNKTNIWDAN